MNSSFSVAGSAAVTRSVALPWGTVFTQTKQKEKTNKTPTSNTKDNKLGYSNPVFLLTLPPFLPSFSFLFFCFSLPLLFHFQPSPSLPLAFPLPLSISPSPRTFCMLGQVPYHWVRSIALIFVVVVLDLIKNCMYVLVVVYACKCSCPQRPEGGIGVPGSGVRVGWELLDVGSGFLQDQYHLTTELSL